MRARVLLGLALTLACARGSDEDALAKAIRAGNSPEVARVLREKKVDPTRRSGGALWLTEVLHWRPERAAKTPVLTEFLAAGMDASAQEAGEGARLESPWRVLGEWHGAASPELEGQAFEDGLLALKLVLDRGGVPWPLSFDPVAKAESGSVFLELGRSCPGSLGDHALQVDFATRLFYLIANKLPRDEVLARLRVPGKGGAPERVSDALRREYERAKAPACTAIADLYDRFAT
jgi:hypothetical protein